MQHAALHRTDGLPRALRAAVHIGGDSAELDAPDGAIGAIVGNVDHQPTSANRHRADLLPVVCL